MTSEQSVKIVEAVVKYRRMIQAYSNAIVRDFHLAEDIYQNVAIIVAQSGDDLPPEDELVPWIREITRRKSLEALRKHKRMPLTLSEDTLTLVAEKFSDEEEEELDRQYEELQRKLIQRCVQKLKGMARKVVDMRYGGEETLSCERIAARLGRSIKAIYNIIGRARLSLAQCVEQEKMRYTA